MKTILVPVDFSEATAPTIETALALAVGCGGEIVLLHVVTPPLEHIQYPGYGGNLWEEGLGLAEQRLKLLVAQIKAKGVAASSKALGGFPIETILTQARDCRADVIVMGRHGHSTFYELLVGSTSSGVLKAARCPVMLTPMQKISASETSRIKSTLAFNRV